MDKAFATDDHTALLEANDGHAFTFFERSDKLTKSASSVITRADMQDHMPPDTHFGTHLITMGAEESFGPNRNGDSASDESLRTHHGSFEKYGHVYREHKNRCPRTQGVGQVKMARYNPEMHRGELIVWIDKEKAPDMYKAAKDGKELSWSMSMRLPYDECSCCGKHSRTTADYCDDLKHHMLQYRDGFQKFAYARNEADVKFFDISEVKRRADRIATYLGYFGDPELMSKAASEIGRTIITGAEWANHLFDADNTAHFTPWEEGTLEKLAAAEEFVRHSQPATLQVLAAMSPASLAPEQIEAMAQPDFRNLAGELSKRAMFVNFPTFAAIVTGKSIETLEKEAAFSAAVGTKLPTLFADLVEKGGCACGEEAAESVTPDEVGCSFSSEKDNIDRLMSEVGDELGMGEQSVNGRVMKVTVVKSAKARKPLEKQAADPFYGAMAEAYGFYLVKAAHIAKDSPGVSEKLLFRGLAASLGIQAS